MRVGEEEALQGFDAMARANPVAEEMLSNRHLSPTPDVGALAKLADGTLGKEFWRYLTDNVLDANLPRESAFYQGTR